MSGVDGWVSIGTGLDTKELEKGIKSAENQLKKYEREAEKLTQQKAKINVDLSAYEKEKQKIEESYALDLKLAQTEEQKNAILNNENLELEKLTQKYSETFQKNDEINKKIQENVNQQGLLNNQIQEMNEKLGQSKNLDNIKDSLEKASSSMTGIIKKVGKWALAIFSVRSAYNFVRQSISTLSQYDDQLASNLEYIRWALANALAPVIKTIVNLAYKLLSYIRYIILALFDVDIFARSSADNFKKAKDNVSGITKETKKLQKQLAGFDEMNILQEDGSVTKGGGGGGTPLPEYNFEDMKPPAWFEKLKEYRDLIKGIGVALGALFGANLLRKIANVIGSASSLTGLSGFNAILSSIANLAAIAITITVVIYAYKKLKEFNETTEKLNENTEQYTKIAKGQIETSKKIAKTIYDKIKAGELEISQVKNAIDAQKDYINMVNDDIDINKDRINQMSFFEKLVPGVYKTYVDNMQLAIDKNMEAINVLLQTAEAYDYDKEKLEAVGISTNDLMEIMKNQIKKIQEVNKYNNSSTQEYKDNINKINELRIASLNLAKGEMQNEINKLEEKNTKLNKNSTEYQKNIDKIKDLKTKMQDLDKTKADIEVLIKANTKDAEKKTGNFFSKLGDSLGTAVSGGLSALFGGGSKALKDTAKKLKNIWFAKGGIISLPGRGVPIGTIARGGEAGQEGVIPLTDAQQMALLGESIGKYVNINLTNITKLDNRQIAREQKIINAQNDFTFNR